MSIKKKKFTFIECLRHGGAKFSEVEVPRCHRKEDEKDVVLNSRGEVRLEVGKNEYKVSAVDFNRGFPSQLWDSENKNFLNWNVVDALDPETNSRLIHAYNFSLRVGPRKRRRRVNLDRKFNRMRVSRRRRLSEGEEYDSDIETDSDYNSAPDHDFEACRYFE